MLGRSGVEVGRIGLGSSYGMGQVDIERGFERGINFLYWGALRHPGFGKAIREIARRHRDELVVAIQSYSRSSLAIGRSVELALRRLHIEYADILVLGWWNRTPSDRILDAALTLREAGKIRHLMISCHHRPAFASIIADPCYDAIMVRYNAACRGAEQEVFPRIAESDAPPGVAAFTATRWGTLLAPHLVPQGEPTPRASDCYRFALTHPQVHMCISRPKNRAELDETLAALERGPMDQDELAWMHRVGETVYRAWSGRTMPWQVARRLARALRRRQLPS